MDGRESKPIKSYRALVALMMNGREVVDTTTLKAIDPDDACNLLFNQCPIQHRDNFRVIKCVEVSTATIEPQGGTAYDNDGEEFGKDLWDDM